MSRQEYEGRKDRVVEKYLRVYNSVLEERLKP